MQLAVEKLRDYYLMLADMSRGVVDCLAKAWDEQAEECTQLLTLYNEMKMTASDWARMKELANLSREHKFLEVLV